MQKFHGNASITSRRNSFSISFKSRPQTNDCHANVGTPYVRAEIDNNNNNNNNETKCQQRLLKATCTTAQHKLIHAHMQHNDGTKNFPLLFIICGCESIQQNCGNFHPLKKLLLPRRLLSTFSILSSQSPKYVLNTFIHLQALLGHGQPQLDWIKKSVNK